MKPYTLICKQETSSEITYGLYERDGVIYYQVNSTPLASNKETNCERELAQMMAQPFRAAKQPKILIIGLGIGATLNAFADALPQKKATFDILDLNKEAFSWFKKHLIETPETIARCNFQVGNVDEFIRSKTEHYHAIFIDPEFWRSLQNDEDLLSKPYLNHFVNALKRGGLLGLITERPNKIALGRLERSGLEVNIELCSVVAGGKRKRVTWLAKKGHYHRNHD